MAVIHDITIQPTALATDSAIRAAIAAEFWRWYAAHEETEITRINWWVIHKTVRVKDVRPVFVLLFGEPTS